MKRRLLILKVLMLLLIVPNYLYAYDFEVGGFFYNINTGGNSVGVTNGDNLYQGIVEIPSEVLYNGKNYHVTNIGNFAFANCSDLTSVTIPNSVIAINNYAFHRCSGLTSVIIPNSIKWIRERAFQGCSSLTSVTIPNSVTSIHATAFAGCFNLTSISVDNGNTTYDSRDNCNAIIETTSNTIVFGCKNTIFPSSVISIGNNAFEGCKGLTSMEIPNSITSIGSEAFTGCSNLNSVNIPNSVTSIGFNAFYECSGLTSITIPNSISVIEDGVFWRSGLTSVIIPNSVTSIGAFAFCACGNLTSVLIPNSVTSIDKGAFENTGMTAVTIPSSVTSIAEYAFNSYTLSSVISEIKEPFPIKSWVFSPYTLTQGRLTVPEGTVISYNSTEGWNEFQNIVEDKQFVEYTFSVKATGNGSASYNGTTVKNNTKSFTLNEGSSATIIFSPDNGYRIKIVKVNSTDVTSSVSNNSYTVSNIKADTTVEVEFEAIPISIYTLSVKATGNGSATYDGTSAKNNTKTFTVNEGTNATITFNPDNGYRIKSVKVNSTDVTSKVSNNSYTISSISANTTLEVEFEAIPIPTYTLSIKATGNGSATYDGTSAKNNTKTFTVNEGSFATITFSPDTGYRIKSVKVNSTDVTSKVSNYSYTISSIKANTTVEVVFEAIPVTTYTLSIKATGNGSATYDGTTAKNNTKTFTVNEGTSATITFSPDNGYRIKNVKVNNTDVTSSVSNNQYTVSNIKANTTVVVEFEAIPIPTYTLSIKATGNGSATYDGITAKNSTKSFTLNEGTSATITFAPDNGYRIKSVKVNSTDVTSSVSNNQYTVSNIMANTTVEVEFEAIPITTYTLSIKATGNGSATYNGTTAKNSTKSFTLNEGANATITFTPDNGYRIKRVKVNSTDVTSSVSNNQYTVSNIKANTTVEVEFEAIPIKTYTLTITASGNGSAVFDGETVRDKSTSFFVNEGTNSTISFTPDNGYQIKSVKVNGTDVTSSVSENQYTINNIKANTKVEVEFEELPTQDRTPKPGDKFEVDGITYEINEDANTVSVTSGSTNYSGDVVIPSQVIYEGKTYSVTCIDIEAFSGCIGLTSVKIPNSVTYISWYAFEGCSSLTSISIPESLNYVVEDAFLRCDNLAAVYISDLEAFFNIFFDLGEYPSNPLFYAHHLFLDGEEIIDLVIPNGVTHIKQYALVNCSSLKSVHIPNSVTSIAGGAFEGCSSLKSIVSEIENPFELNTVAFSDDTYANAILIVPKGTKVAYQAAEGWNHFTNIVEAGDDPTISGQCGDNVHYSYDRTTHTLTINGDGPMYSMDMEDYYPWWSFSNDIQHVKIESGVTSIGYSAFSQSGLTSITIPNSVTSIGDYAFNACYNLSSIISEIEYPFEIAKEVWGDLLYIRSDVQLIVPKGTKAAYQATEGWNQFTNIVEAGGTEPDQPGQIHINDIIYKVIGSGEAEVVSADNGVTSITIPSTVSHNNNSYKVTAIAKDAFENCEHLAAVIWEPEVQFNAKVNNPNLLLYVNDDKYASRSVKNVVVDGIAESIELTDAASGNDFYCPRAFRARSIVYSHNYQMETGIGDSRGWETIVLPFDVQKYTHATKGELESFTTWSKGSSKKPFWLFELTASGYKDVASIKANTPYIISMPNNKQYEQQYQIPGIVTFSAENVEVQKSDNLTPASYQTRKFVPNYANKDDDDLLPLNVSNNYVTNPGKEINGSKFVRGLRAVHPFEAYMTTTDNTRTIDVMEGLSTAIKDIRIVENEASVIKVYDTRGILLKTATSMDDARAGLKAGVYIVNGKKMIIK